MCLTYLIAFVTKVAEKIFIIMQFQTVIEVVSAHNNVVVKVVFVNMSGDNRFMIFEFFKASDELHSDIVCLLR